MEENIVRQGAVMVQNAQCVELYIPIEKRNLYVKSHKNQIIIIK